MRYTKNIILVPVNFSEYANRALKTAIDIAVKWKSKLVLYHVINIPDYSGLDEQARSVFTESVKETVLQKMKDLSFNAFDQGIKIDIEMAYGQPGPEILKYIKDENVGLVVLGSKSYKKMDEMLGGSAMERLLRYSMCPILTVKKEVALNDIKDIVYATDLGYSQPFILTELKKLQEVFGAKLHVLKVNTKDNWKSDEELEKQFVKFNQLHDLKNYEFKISNSETVEEGILHYYKSVNAQMVAMPTHSLVDASTDVRNYFITERIFLDNPSMFWSCINAH
ncbi:universal stress protein [Fulvivirga lutimaris]|uniref:universal stress protein n=1 Tax=Fulvivirga lutimaris TaxID=1819566 RepID=UPI0012BC98D6|nr:universal stress protein [Fulvivirga lutimaris]MTI40446.1 universal stress protein [Fulvivirga lutimaris]